MSTPAPRQPRVCETPRHIGPPTPNGDPNNRSVRRMFSQVYNSFYYAFEGLVYVLLTQRNMRFHFFAALGVMSMAIILGLSPIEKAFLFIVISFVFSMEVLNTCIETFTDIVSPTYHRLAKVAKDTAAAAVLVVSIGSVMSAGYLLIPRFFRTVLHPQFLHTAAKDLVAFAVILGAVIVFWFWRGIVRVAQAPILILCAACAAFSISFLCYAGRDFLSFCATLFFSFLLFASIAKKMSPAWVFAGQLLGVIAYAVRLWTQ